MILELTATQAAALRAESKPGRTILAAIAPEIFDGTNADTSGRLQIQFGSVETKALPALREAILKASKPRKRRAKNPNENRDPNIDCPEHG